MRSRTAGGLARHRGADSFPKPIGLKGLSLESAEPHADGQLELSNPVSVPSCNGECCGTQTSPNCQPGDGANGTWASGSTVPTITAERRYQGRQDLPDGPSGCTLSLHNRLHTMRVRPPRLRATRSTPRCYRGATVATTATWAAEPTRHTTSGSRRAFRVLNGVSDVVVRPPPKPDSKLCSSLEDRSMRSLRRDQILEPTVAVKVTYGFESHRRRSGPAWRMAELFFPVRQRGASCEFTRRSS
jgi:hypothetical protein